MGRKKISEKRLQPSAIIEKPIGGPTPGGRELPPEAPPEARLVFVVCPLCGMSRILEKTGDYGYRHKTGEPKPAKGRIKFEVDLDNYPFIDFRDSGGRIAGYRGKRRGEVYTRRELYGVPTEKTSYGFPRVGAFTLDEAIDNGQYNDLLQQLQNQISHIKEKLNKINP